VLPPKNFQKPFLEAVEEGLSTLGDTPKQAIIFHLENTFKIKRDDIPKNLTEFQKALEKIFGPGAAYLERLILKKLHEKLQLEFEELLENQQPNLTDTVENIKKRLFLGDA
jgi:predicted transcriptional regulator